MGHNLWHQSGDRCAMQNLRCTTDFGSGAWRAVRVHLTCLMAGTILGTQAPTLAARGERESVDFFEMRVRPVLVEHCYKCHSVESKKRKGDLWLDSRVGILEGGKSGPALVPGDPEKSRLIEAIRYRNPDLQMPPDHPLPPAVVADFEAWIRMGAPDPRVKDPEAIAFGKAALHWSFQLPRDHPIPVVKDASWPLNAVHRCVLARLEKAKLSPALRVDKRNL